MKQAVVAIVKHPEIAGLFAGVSRKNNHNDWNLPGGKIDEGEDSETAMIRELKEELGIVINAGTLKGFSVDIVYSSPTGTDFEVTTYMVTAESSDLCPSPGEGLAKWMTAEELCNGVFADHNRVRFSKYKDLHGSI